MLSTILSWTSVFDLEHRVLLDIGRVSGGAVANYRVTLSDEMRHHEFASAKLEQYPRWSEPVTGLVARALDSCLRSGTPAQLVSPWPVRTVQVRIALVPGGTAERSELLRLTADFRQMRAPVMCTDERRGGVWEKRDLRITSEDPMRLALHCLSQWTWETAAPGLWPTPLQVPVRGTGQLAYVRMSDIPEPARSEFSRRIVGATIPAIRGETDIAYAADWQGFIEGQG